MYGMRYKQYPEWGNNSLQNEVFIVYSERGISSRQNEVLTVYGIRH